MDILTTYKIKKHVYKEIYDKELKLPNKIKMIYNDDEIGYGIYKGFNHYIGFIKKSDYNVDILDIICNNNSVNIITYEFIDIIILVIDNILPIDPLPVYSSDEIMKEYKLDEYYIMYRDPITLKKILDSYPNTDFLNDFYRVSKIKSIEGPYSISTVDIYYDNHICTIELTRNNYIDKVLNVFRFEKNEVIYTKSPTVFNELYAKVMNKINEHG